MRLPARPGELIDRSRPVTFTFRQERIDAFAGDTIGSALYASGHRVFSRSFKYHRRRGLLCCSGHCANCMMSVDDVPNVRVCVEPVRQGAHVQAQNVLGSLERDLLAVIDRAGGPFTPVGFYYRTMIRPHWAWPLYEKVLRNIAGLGSVAKDGRRTGRFDTEHRRVGTLVIGGGRAGSQAALAAVGDGGTVALVDERLAPVLDGVETIAPARALGIYEGGLVPVDAGNVLLRFRAERIVVATGALEQPLVFPGNDLVGVMLPNGVRRLVREWAIRPGERAVVIAPDAATIVDDLRAAGTEVARVFDLRERAPREIVATGRRGRVDSILVDGEAIECDLLVMSGGRQPAYSLLAQAGARIEYDARAGIFVPCDLPPNVEAAGSVTGADNVFPNLFPASAGKRRFVCLCEDVTTKDIRRAIAEGFDSLELAKRYTTVTMGPCQGKLCQLASIRVYAAETATDEATIGTTTARPPWAPVSLGLLAGRPHEPVKRTAIQHRHEEAGATMMWTGAWRRPHSYGDPGHEAQHVHEAVGVIDVSTLGKLLVTGPDAATFLERLYSNRFTDLSAGRLRYGVLSTDAGRIMDDGTVARLSEEHFYVTTTSTGAEHVLAWFEWWNAVWGYDVDIVDVTGALTAVNVAGPRSRELLGRLTDLDVSSEGLRYLDAREALVAGVPCLVLRIGFVGELGYELHFPAPAGEYVWDTLLERGADLNVAPFGLEPQRILRLEKQHLIAGQDTDSESTVLAAGMPWIAKLDKEDFIGKWALEHAAEGPFREVLVGFELPSGSAPAEGAQVVDQGRPVGRVTSSRWSETVGKGIGLAWLPPALAEEGAELAVRVDGKLERAVVRLTPFFDAAGERQRA
ncbi:MAG: 2Fe-2S iron-sulfur cluster-binding protein [Gaiellaceae bacterium]